MATSSVDADDRRVQIRFTPTQRAQLAVWIESDDGERFGTVRLTNAVALRGIANRPGAMQMNSGFRWPYGRREGSLPIWAHRRHDATGLYFPRVIFAGRASEGHASRSGFDEVQNTRDDYYCLSFTNGDEALDAVSCASVFMSNKGRYVVDSDVTSGYAEPFEVPGGGAQMRPLGVGSLYPPRQDLSCDHCGDHADTARFREDTRAVMPDIDAVSMATPAANAPFMAVFDVPADWPDGHYVAFVEANTEGDYAPGWDTAAFPTPEEPAGTWDSWAIGSGYAYRGQPSVVYEVPFDLDASGGTWTGRDPAGYGDLHGISGEIVPMDGTIRDDHDEAPGSGADRLLEGDNGVRVTVVVPPTDVCLLPEPPAECGRECDAGHPCAAGFLCTNEGTCGYECAFDLGPDAPTELALDPHPERKHAHAWAVLEFRVPESARGLTAFEVRTSHVAPFTTDPASFKAQGTEDAVEATLMTERLVIPVTVDPEDPTSAPLPPGTPISVEIGGLRPESTVFVAVRALDRCDAPGAIATTEFTTSPVYFTTVSPCFVATAAYGSPLASRVRVLRRFRDRHLATNAVGRALIDAYYAVGPTLAGWIAEDDDRRAAARALLEPIVDLVE